MGITMTATGAFRKTGASFFFIPKGALTHHRAAGPAVVLLLRISRALCEADCALFGERQTMPPSLRTLVVIACTAGRQLAPCLPLRCKLLSFVGTPCHPPAKTCHWQLYRSYGRCYPAPSIFFCLGKRNKTAPCGVERK